MNLEDEFQKAAKDVHQLKEKPDNATLLKLYALYKQGSEGDVKGDRPGGFDFKGAAKFDAWKELEGMDEEKAKNQYITLVNQLLDS